MNNTRIETYHKTVNTIHGCRGGCGYCYAVDMADRLAGRHGYDADDPFKPEFSPKALDDIYKLENKTGLRVFINSMSDIWGEDVEKSWVRDTMDAIKCAAGCEFFCLTKRPDRIPYYDNFVWPENLWAGVTVTCTDDLWRIDVLRDLKPDVRKFISFEPLLGKIDFTDYSLDGFEWIHVGPVTGKKAKKFGLPPKDGSWIEPIVVEAEASSTLVFFKTKLKPFLGDFKLVQEVPNVLIVES